jgi:1-acyl-sn-glycerol-3-phosphate acyltransferase
MLAALLPPTLLGLVAGAVLIGGMIGAFLLFIPLMVLKALLPVTAVRRACTELMFAIVRQWGAFNRVACRVLYPVQWDVEVRGEFVPGASYLLVCNHQSWIDILLLVEQLAHRVPPLCFFLKRELLWMPVIGQACWAMDFPFMKRHTREEIERDPSLRDEDLKTTRAFCERFRTQPVTVVNFVEGTRFSEHKRIARRSPYRHLLRPKAAGLSFTLNAMGDQMAGLVDVTIAYRPSRHPPVWSFLIGEQTHLAIRVDVLPLPEDLLHGDYQNDAAFRTRFQDWINTLWARKDARLEHLINGRAAGAPRTREA